LTSKIIDWPSIATKLGFPDEVEMWTSYYLRRKLSILDLSQKFAVSPAAVRGRLVKLGVPMRPRGGANFHSKIVVPDLEAQCAEHGVPKVADAIGLNKTTVYARLRKLRAAKKPA